MATSERMSRCIETCLACYKTCLSTAMNPAASMSSRRISG
jgi:hypothetical protein